MSTTFWLNFVIICLIVEDYGRSKELIALREDCTCTDVCKEDKKELLGQGTWNLLHSMVDNVERTEDNEQLFKNFVKSLQFLYPCSECRHHLQKMSFTDIEMTPLWLCEFHNKVNIRLKKKLHDCGIYQHSMRVKDTA